MTEGRRGSASTIASTLSDTYSSVTSDCEVTVRLLDLMHKTDYNLVQENGQRRLTAPELTKEHRERIKGAEVFLGRLPRDCYEDELMPVLERPGRLLELRLMLDFSGLNRGYGFALYADARIAREACKTLDGFEIRPGHQIGAVKSVDNCRLFFGGVPKNKTKEEFMTELSKLMDGIVDIYLYPNAQDRSLNRGFIFVEFKDHRSAAMARRKLIPGRVLLWDHEVAVDWADPEPGEPVDEEIMGNVTALFVRNLSTEISQQKIRDVFQRATNIPIVKLKKINHFAFVHYENRELAEKAMQIMTSPGGISDVQQWEIQWAKPIGPIKQAERQRCINEAMLLQSRNQKETKAKRIVKKQFSKVTMQLSHADDDQEPLNYQHLNFFADFVLKTFQARCSFECLENAEMGGFIYKITIFREHMVLLQEYGPVQPTKQLSLDMSISVVYEKLKASLGFHTYQNTFKDTEIVDDLSSHMMHLNFNAPLQQLPEYSLPY